MAVSPAVGGSSSNPYASYARSLRVEEREYRYYQIRELGAEKYGQTAGLLHKNTLSYESH